MSTHTYGIETNCTSLFVCVYTLEYTVQFTMDGWMNEDDHNDDFIYVYI